MLGSAFRTTRSKNLQKSHGQGHGGCVQWPIDLLSAMQMAEQIGSTFANACVIDKKGSRKQPAAVPITVTSSRND